MPKRLLVPERRKRFSWVVSLVSALVDRLVERQADFHRTSLRYLARTKRLRNNVIPAVIINIGAPMDAPFYKRKPPADLAARSTIY